MKHIPADLSVPVKSARSFRPLKDAWIDTTSPPRSRMLTVLGGLADFERDLIAARTGEGRKRARERGVKFGRPRKLTPHQRQEALARLCPFRSGDGLHRFGFCTGRQPSRGAFFNVVNFDRSNRFSTFKLRMDFATTRAVRCWNGSRVIATTSPKSSLP